MGEDDGMGGIGKNEIVGWVEMRVMDETGGGLE